MRHYCVKPIEKVWKVTEFTRTWLSIKSIMSWAKSSASAGLEWFTLKEVARGAFQLEEFQMLEDPLVVNDKYRSVMKEVRIKLNMINFSSICIKNVKQCKLLCFTCYRRWKGMRRSRSHGSRWGKMWDWL